MHVLVLRRFFVVEHEVVEHEVVEHEQVILVVRDCPVTTGSVS